MLDVKEPGIVPEPEISVIETEIRPHRANKAHSSETDFLLQRNSVLKMRLEATEEANSAEQETLLKKLESAVKELEQSEVVVSAQAKMLEEAHEKLAAVQTGFRWATGKDFGVALFKKCLWHTVPFGLCAWICVILLDLYIL